MKRRSDFVLDYDFVRSSSPRNEIEIHDNPNRRKYVEYNQAALNGGALNDSFISKLSKEILPVARDAVYACVDEDIHVSPKQLQAAVLAAITTFISTLMNKGHYEQGYRAAIAVSKSMPRDTFAAKESTKNIRDNKKRVTATILTASDLLKRAAESSLTGMPKDIKEMIGNDVSTMMKMFSFIPAIKADEEALGSGMVGGAAEFDVDLNTDWLGINGSGCGELRGAGIGDWLSSLGSSISNFFSTSGDAETYANAVDSAPYFDYNATSYDPTAASYNSSGSNSSGYNSTGYNSTGYNSTDYNSTYNYTSNSTANTTSTSTPASTAATSTPAGGWGSTIAAGLAGIGGFLTGTPIGLAISAAVAPKIITELTPIVWKLGENLIWKPVSKVADATYGRFRRYIKSQDWDVPDTSQANSEYDDDASFSPLKATKHFVTRALPAGLKNIYQYSDKATSFLGKQIDKFKSDPATQQHLVNLKDSFEKLLPAATQDYLLYKQKMLVHEAAMKKYNASVDYLTKKSKKETAEKNEQIDIENARIIADRNEERKKAILENEKRDAINEQRKKTVDDLRKEQNERYKQTVTEAYALHKWQVENRRTEVTNAKIKAGIAATVSLMQVAHDVYQGTLAGAAAGTVIPGVGNAVGGVVGAAAGLAKGLAQSSLTTGTAAYEFYQIAQKKIDEGKEEEAQKAFDMALKYGDQFTITLDKMAKAQKDLTDEQVKIQKDIITNLGNAAMEGAKIFGHTDPSLQPFIMPKPEPRIPDPELLYHVAVPDEIKAGDPLLRKHVEDIGPDLSHLVMPTLPGDIYSAPHMKQVLSVDIPAEQQRKAAEKAAADEAAKALLQSYSGYDQDGTPYVKPIQQVNPGPRRGPIGQNVFVPSSSRFVQAVPVSQTSISSLSRAHNLPRPKMRSTVARSPTAFTSIPSTPYRRSSKRRRH